jgi:arabinose-5-phosphate isomerase
MRGGGDVPKVTAHSLLKDAIAEMTRGRIGMTAVLDASSASAAYSRWRSSARAPATTDVTATKVGDVMSKAPRTIRPEALAAEAVNVMESHKVNQLLVVDSKGDLVGALNMHDLFRAKVI